MKDNDLKSDLDKIIRDIYHLHIVQRHEMTRLLDKTDDPIKAGITIESKNLYM